MGSLYVPDPGPGSETEILGFVSGSCLVGNSTYLDCYGDQWVLEQQYREGSEWLEHSEKVVIDMGHVWQGGS